jgi:hypothetical protein
VKEMLVNELQSNFYGSDLDWIQNDKLVGLPNPEYKPRPNRGLTAQRGLRFM